MRKVMVLAVAALLGVAAGCGGDDDAGADETLVVYSGREEELVEPLFERFEQETGIDVEVRYGDSAELAATIAEEGDNSPGRRLLRAGPGLARRRRARRAARGAAAGSARPCARALPRSGRPLGGHVGPLARDRVQHRRAFGGRGSGLRLRAHRSEVEGQDRHRAHERVVPGVRQRHAARARRGAHAHLARGAEGERPEALREEHARRRGRRLGRDRARARQPLLPLPRQGGEPRGGGREPLPHGRGPRRARVSVAGAAILETADHADAAQQFVEFLLSEPSQRFYVDEAEEAEYPLVPGIEAEGRPPAARRARAGRRSSSTSSAPSSRRRSSC